MLQNSALCPYWKLVLLSLVLPVFLSICTTAVWNFTGSIAHTVNNVPIILGDVRIVRRLGMIGRTRTIRERKVWHRSKACGVLQVASFLCSSSSALDAYLAAAGRPPPSPCTVMQICKYSPLCPTRCWQGKSSCGADRLGCLARVGKQPNSD